MRSPLKYYEMIAKAFQHIYQNIFKITESGDNKITEDGDTKITEDSDN